MSEYTQCNRCKLDDIERRSKARNDEVVIKPVDSAQLLAEWPNAVSVYVAGRFVATFLAISESCAC